MSDGRSKLDVTHPLAADARSRDLDAAAVADDALELDLLILPAMALPVPGGAENALAEEAIALGLEGPIVDGLRLLNLAVGKPADLLR